MDRPASGDAIEYLLEENRVLREQVGDRWLRFTDAQGRRLAEKGERPGRKRLVTHASTATPESILRWHRKLIAVRRARTSHDSLRASARPDRRVPRRKLAKKDAILTATVRLLVIPVRATGVTLLGERVPAASGKRRILRAIGRGESGAAGLEYREG